MHSRVVLPDADPYALVERLISASNGGSNGKVHWP